MQEHHGLAASWKKDRKNGAKHSRIERMERLKFAPIKTSRRLTRRAVHCGEGYISREQDLCVVWPLSRNAAIECAICKAQVLLLIELSKHSRLQIQEGVVKLQKRMTSSSC